MRNLKTIIPPEDCEIISSPEPLEALSCTVRWSFMVSERTASVAFYPMINAVEIKVLDLHGEVQAYKLEGDWDLSERTPNGDYFPKRIEADLYTSKAKLIFN